MVKKKKKTAMKTTKWNPSGFMKELVAQLYPTSANPWTVAHQAPLSMEFSRQEYWNG